MEDFETKLKEQDGGPLKGTRFPSRAGAEKAVCGLNGDRRSFRVYEA